MKESAKKVPSRFTVLCAAEGLGGAEGLIKLGNTYFVGAGVTKDVCKAVRCYYKCAISESAFDLSHPSEKVSEQFRLEVANSPDKYIITRSAARWYRWAAEQGHASAQFALGASYFLGEGNIKSEREAYIWWTIADVEGFICAAECLFNIKWRDYLTVDEMHSAKKDAVERLATIDRGRWRK